MANILTIPVSAPPATTKVVVDYYDNTNRDLLLRSPATEVLRTASLPKTLDISTVDMLTYYLFYKRRPGVDGYSSYQEIRSKYHHALVEFDGLVRFENGSLQVGSQTTLDSGTTERLGEAIGLSVISHLHQLTEADWVKITETSKCKTLDYEYAASDGLLLIKTETKGSIIKDNRFKKSSISQHKASIMAKKGVERNTEANTSQSAILYGTIGVLDGHKDGVARCWLLDPPLNLEASPEQFRVLARLAATTDLISFLSPRSSLAAAIQTRLGALRALRRIEELDGVPLRRGSGEIFSTQMFSRDNSHNPWLVGKSRVLDGPVGGQVSQIDANALIFVGIREELLVYAINQSFQEISTYRFPSGTTYKGVQCVVPAGRFRAEFSLGSDDRVKVKESGGYFSFELDGYLHYTSGGMVFGVLPLPEVTRRRHR